MFSDQSISNVDSNENYLVLNPPKNLFHLLNEFNNFMPNSNHNPENLIDISQIKNLPNYSYEFCPTESTVGGTFIEINNSKQITLLLDISINSQQ